MKKRSMIWFDIKKMRKERGLLQKEAAEMLGISRTYLSAIENKKRGISPSVIKALYTEFDISHEQFWIIDYPRKE